MTALPRGHVANIYSFLSISTISIKIKHDRIANEYVLTSTSTYWPHFAAGIIVKCFSSTKKNSFSSFLPHLKALKTKICRMMKEHVLTLHMMMTSLLLGYVNNFHNFTSTFINPIKNKLGWMVNQALTLSYMWQWHHCH